MMEQPPRSKSQLLNLLSCFPERFCKFFQEITYERRVNQTSHDDVSQGIKNEFVYKRQVMEFVTLSLRRIMVFAFVLVLRRAWR